MGQKHHLPPRAFSSSSALFLIIAWFCKYSRRGYTTCPASFRSIFECSFARSRSTMVSLSEWAMPLISTSLSSLLLMIKWSSGVGLVLLLSLSVYLDLWDRTTGIFLWKTLTGQEITCFDLPEDEWPLYEKCLSPPSSEEKSKGGVDSTEV